MLDEAEFWAMIERAWQKSASADLDARRGALAVRDADEVVDLAALWDGADAMIKTLLADLDRLSQGDLLAFDRVLERKVHDLDRPAMEAIGESCSRDTFLYRRGFVVAMGKGFYDAVLRDPTRAVPDAECELMPYASWHLHRKKFGSVPSSGISRE